MQRWRPSWWARVLRGVGPWELRLRDGFLDVVNGAVVHELPISDLGDPGFDRDGHWTTIVVPVSGESLRLGGATRATASSLSDALNHERAVQAETKQIRAAAEREVVLATRWHESVAREGDKPVWLAYDTVTELERDRPSLDAVDHAASNPRLDEFARSVLGPAEAALQSCRNLDLRTWAAERNRAFLNWEMTVSKEFFDTVEKSPLTSEQIEATACFDNRVRVIASAGSGKTSVMVARAGYAIHRKLAAPEQILMLAFNKKAAEELKERVVARMGHDGAGVQASTFHSLGLRVIGEASGKKPSVPDDLPRDNGIRRLSQIVDRRRDADPSFRRDWDLFRLVFGRPLAELGAEIDPEEWDRTRGISGFRTLAGEVVRSQEEVMIANWLFLNGVEYEYERDYEHDTADAHHRQYTPDFYYPRIDAYHEHWAVDANGNPPADFEGYADGMRWKRDLHQRMGTRLIETTSASIREGGGFDHLASELQRLGQPLDENPYRDVPGEEPITDLQMLKLLRSFIAHAKGNQVSTAELTDKVGRTNLRSRLFLRIYGAALEDWNRGLADRRAVDFEDMLNQASHLIEAGRWASPYRVVMVDEMQDTSPARARLVAALTQTPGTYLLCVGDDWQSINRFAGSDISVMTDFERRFGPSQTVYLTNTFRSPQSLCDVAGHFIAKNLAQIPKQVRSAAPPVERSVIALSVRSRGEYDRTAHEYLTDLDHTVDGATSILVLGRYVRMRDDFTETLSSGYEHLDVEYSTVHSSKGREADYVLIPGLERKGFPSTREDDPLLSLVMGAEDMFPFAEERRLFYVGLTRARRSVALLTVSGKESPFLLELVQDGLVAVTSLEGEDATPVVCPRCTVNRLVKRKGRYGEFLGCTGYPGCTVTRQV